MVIKAKYCTFEIDEKDMTKSVKITRRSSGETFMIDRQSFELFINVLNMKREIAQTQNVLDGIYLAGIYKD